MSKVTPEAKWAALVAKLAVDRDPALARAARALRDAPEPPRGKRFGARALRLPDGPMFAFVSNGKIVLKLPKARVDELVADGAAEHFDPGHGRVMKEWVALTDGDWTALVREALAFTTETKGKKR